MRDLRTGKHVIPAQLRTELTVDPENGSTSRRLALERYAYCALGALAAVLQDPDLDWLSGHRGQAVQYLEQAARCNRLAVYNDTHTHAEVVAVFRLAISRAEYDERLRAAAMMLPSSGSTNPV